MDINISTFLLYIFGKYRVRARAQKNKNKNLLTKLNIVKQEIRIFTIGSNQVIMPYRIEQNRTEKREQF